MNIIDLNDTPLYNYHTFYLYKFDQNKMGICIFFLILRKIKVALKSFFKILIETLQVYIIYIVLKFFLCLYINKK